MRWLEFLVRLRSTGMPMRDMQRYAQLLRESQAPENVAERQAMLEQHALRLEEDQRVLGETLQLIRSKICRYQELQTLPKRA